MHEHAATLIAFGAAACLAGAAAADTISTFSLADNGWTYYEENLSGGRTSSTGGFADYVFGNVDHFYQNWWWYRGTNDTREYALSNQVSGNASGNTAQLRYSEPVAGVADAMQVDLEYTLTGVNAGEAEVRIDWMVTNTTVRDLTIDFFAYMDVDLDGTAGNDNAELVSFNAGGGQIRVTETGSDSVMDLTAGNLAGADLVGWEIAGFPAIRNKLTNVVTDNLANAGSPFGPGDFSSAYQHRMTLDVGQSASGTIYKRFSVPGPGALPLLALGALAGRRRRRRRD